MTYLAAGLIVLLVAVAAGVASFVAGRLLGAEHLRRHHDFGRRVFQQVGILFSVLLSFVFSEVWTEYNTAAQAVSRECGSLHGAAMLAGTLHNGVGRPVNSAILDYGRIVAQVEWPLMRQGQRSPQAAEAFRTALDRAVSLRAEQPAELATRSQIVSLLVEAHAARETRTFQMTLGVPVIVWTVLIAMTLILDGCLLFAGSEVRSHVVLAAAASASTAAALVMVKMLDLPFEGGLALSSSDFIKMTREVASLLAIT